MGRLTRGPHQLPEKVVVVHELAPNIIRDEEVIQSRKGVALIKSVDSIGSRAMKEETWRKLTTKLPKGMRVGFKLFFEEDGEFGPLMTPAEVLALKADRRLRPLRVDPSGVGDVGVELVEPRRGRDVRRHAPVTPESEPPAATLGPLGRADRLNWLAKKRRRNTSNQRRIVEVVGQALGGRVAGGPVVGLGVVPGMPRQERDLRGAVAPAQQVVEVEVLQRVRPDPRLGGLRLLTSLAGISSGVISVARIDISVSPTCSSN